MDATRLIELIKSPESLNQEDLVNLKDLVDRHPFFSIGHLLYLNGLKKTDLASFESELNRSAVRIADRSVLYQLIKQAQTAGSNVSGVRSVELTIEEPKVAVARPTPEVVKPTPVPVAAAPQSITESVAAPPVQVVTAPIPAPVPQPEAPITKAEPVSKPESVVAPKPKVSLDDIFAGTHDDLDEDIVLIESTTVFIEEKIEITLTEEKPEEIPTPLAEEKTEEEIIPSAGATEILITEEDELSTSPEEEEIKIMHTIEADLGLHEPVEKEIEVIAEPSVPEIKEETNKQPMPSKKMNLGSFNSWLKQQLEEKNQAQKESGPLDEKSIIDKFIEAEPKINKPKAEFFNPIESSKKSVLDNESIVSETLAKIYADQGDYDKAISAYKKLSLEKPEKSTYFAALIYELELKQSLE